MLQDLISITIAPEHLKAIDAALTALEAQFDDFIELSAEQRRELVKLGPRSEVFCRETLSVMERSPGALPAAEMDSKILKAAILNGAIELLPENLSTLAIIPLQMRLVYQIGQSYGYELDRGHIKDLLAALGVGLTSQYLEEAGRKLLGGLLGKAGKGIFGGLGKQAVSSGMSFASTYALGHVANQYYAGGRQLSTDMLKDAYQHVMQDGRQLQARYLPQMQDTARGLNTAKILSMVRGGGV